MVLAVYILSEIRYQSAIEGTGALICARGPEMKMSGVCVGDWLLYILIIAYK
jgi:hypothetical protein